ncbi:MAG TPA: cytochrome b/b6 domain-containing protein [Roseiarcus sp.]|jgi:cytochrome b
MIRVWDPLVRTFHWALALSFAVAWLSGEDSERLHQLAGYTIAALVLARIAWGFLGPPYARFSQFVRPPAVVADYLKSIVSGSEPRFIGHNPAGGAMIVVLLASLAATTVTGWMLTTDAFWGSTTVQRLHSILAHGVLFLIVIHLAGVAVASVRHNENLVRAMTLGFKRAPGPGDVA